MSPGPRPNGKRDPTAATGRGTNGSPRTRAAAVQGGSPSPYRGSGAGTAELREWLTRHYRLRGWIDLNRAGNR